MFVEKLLKKELNIVTKHLLALIAGRQNDKMYFKQGELSRFRTCVLFRVKMDRLGSILCYMDDFYAQVSADKKIYIETDDVWYHTFMYKKFGQEYVDALSDHLLNRRENNSNEAKARVKSHINTVIKLAQEVDKLNEINYTYTKGDRL